MRWLKLLIASVGIAASGTALALPQPEAEAAYERGDYKTAFALWLPLAEQGSPRAQMNIASMYEKGQYVAQDSAMAAEWYRKAAQQSMSDSANSPASTAGASPTGVGGTTTSPSVQPAYAQSVQPAYVQPTYVQPTTVQPARIQPVYYPTVPLRLAPSYHHWRRR